MEHEKIVSNLDHSLIIRKSVRIIVLDILYVIL